MNPENLRRKIKAMRALAAPGSGATDDERATALRLADELELRLKKMEAPPAPRKGEGYFRGLQQARDRVTPAPEEADMFWVQGSGQTSNSTNTGDSVWVNL